MARRSELTGSFLITLNGLCCAHAKNALSSAHEALLSAHVLCVRLRRFVGGFRRTNKSTGAKCA